MKVINAGNDFTSVVLSKPVLVWRDQGVSKLGPGSEIIKLQLLKISNILCIVPEMDWNGMNGQPVHWQQGSPTTGAPVIMHDNVLNYKDYQAAGLGILGQGRTEIQGYQGIVGQRAEIQGYQQLRADLVGQQTYQAVEMRTVQQLVPEIEYVQMQVQVPQIEYVPMPFTTTQQFMPEPPPERRERYIPDPPTERRERAQPPPPPQEEKVSR